MSGHSKWSTIKRRKGAQDAKRSKVFTKIIKEITVAARSGGGDPGGNPRLRQAIDLARASNMPNDNITRAIKKGTGELEGQNYEDLLYEGVGPAGTLFLCPVVTDNRNRTASEVRKIFDKHQGQLGAAGAAAWAFDHRGLLRIDADGVDEERVFELAVNAGAEDVNNGGSQFVVTTAREDLEAVRSALEADQVTVAVAELAYIPKNAKVVESAEAERLLSLVEALEDHDDVQKVFADFELSEESLAALEQA